MPYVTKVPTPKALKIGLPGIIEITMLKELEGTYKTSISDIDFKKNLIFLSIPTYKGHFIPIPKGTRMNVKFFDRSSMYTFSTISLGVIKKDNLYMIPVPAPEYVNKTERRRFKRIPLFLFGTFKLSPKTNAEAIQFMTKDFSAGGIKIVTDAILHLDDIIYINLKLDENLQLENQKSKIIRADQKTEEGFQYGVEFLDVPTNLENKLVRFVFQKELKAKK
ncbi:pilus assembly protein PilZ [Thermosipho melanesiensis]|uniref:Type IV pilus assembly PilZ n=2 Tax=Thermosipho melanesiensis TaxID=46541 RepID=A6LMY0_THEM4|nr:PilZ domain-containing protein [Thermosipho melanesiensis]ABR31281.1 type IV pilus assembly PilZ [Thermosipho melanesiensis BI429]APT74361.1 pilus assembly protein PilZ [Thermosipho melanesiensis]OOC36304.1 pilus assembly protein PilZ [Thermosipho melanesiensis]OOC37122.1 pilus assembly protein PilZ [Thermosipho melanesiensis]OOC37874.1 pilus assembly protein PilZ [Thermosipho melanesiensis]